METKNIQANVTPDYVQAVNVFLGELKTIPWLKPDGNPDPDWRIFETRDAAWNAAVDATRGAAWNTVWDAVWDATRGAAWNNEPVCSAGIRAAAWDAARNAALDAARGAAWDAALMARILICTGLPLEQKYIDHAAARMNVWRKGYGLLCDIDGVLYVYKKTK